MISTTTVRHKLADLPTAADALAELCEPFVPPGMEFSPYCVAVQPVHIPTADRRCLAHREHMTEVLEHHHGKPVAVQVQEYRQEGSWYSRKITLTPGAESRKIIECGIVRMDFRYMSDQVRDEILARKTPLGRVLIKHNVLRWIEPLWFVQLPPGSDVMKLFGIETTEPVFGRIAVIYCNGEPAIDLLEIVTNADCG
jgi:chorismate-pyruvate lyase